MASPAQTAPRLQTGALPGWRRISTAGTPCSVRSLAMPRRSASTIIYRHPNTYLYLVLGHGQAVRYGIGVGRDGPLPGRACQSITKKSEWPDWTPPAEMIARQPYLPRYMAGGPWNPLGARAMYSRRYHLSHSRHQRSRHQSVPVYHPAAFRLTNDDVADLYSRVNVGTKVVVLPMDRHADNSAAARLRGRR